MNIKNFATFGLFVDGSMIDSGSIHAMENEATRRILNRQSETAHISVFDIDGDKVIEGTPVLSLRRNHNDIVIVNMLQPHSSGDVKTNRTMIEIKDIVDEIMECDSLVDRSEFDTVRCNIGSGILWTCDLLELERYFDIKGVISEGDNLAMLIRNF